MPLNIFSASQALGNFLLANKLSTSTATIDTITVLYTGYAAQNSKQLDSAAKYYSMLADLKVGGSDYEDIYKFLVEYYSEKKDNANYDKIFGHCKRIIS